MMTGALVLLAVAILAVAYAKSQRRGQEVFVSTHIEVLPDCTTREVKAWQTATEFDGLDDRRAAIRRHNIAMLVAVGAATVGGVLAGATVLIHR